ncbi:Arp2/3 complex subunit [Penicillium atrosanguineum]|uniref:Arp2/3 complex subunit n=1 Tax=Penicillium atrosanguineum TaxID=1132637 RepID=UPI002386EEBA|nr:Arp2/3 complex subunit [Penicillium atrosanguineum]KAJ5314360.1 Arp2/3 complex subunit [Penicillium atrosanguineum]
MTDSRVSSPRCQAIVLSPIFHLSSPHLPELLLLCPYLADLIDLATISICTFRRPVLGAYSSTQPIATATVTPVIQHLSTPILFTAASPSQPPHPTPSTYIMAPRKPRCNFKECKEAAQRIVGDCSFCAGHFCSKHRMLEAHSCSGLEDCKKESHARNADKLNSERTVVVKGV